LEGIELNISLSPDPPQPQLRDGDKFGVVSERDFREKFIAYCGPMERFENKNIVLYYTVDEFYDICITILDVTRQMAVLRMRAPTSSATTIDDYELYDAKLDTRMMSVTKIGPLPEMDPLWKEKSFLTELTKHYRLVTTHFSFRSEAQEKDTCCKLKLNWLLVLPECVFKLVTEMYH